MVALPDRPTLVKCGYISFCSCFGTLARLYTDDIGPASNVALQGSFLANSLGSFALGVFTSSPDRETASEAVYAGLTVVRVRRLGHINCSPSTSTCFGSFNGCCLTTLLLEAWR